MGKDPAFLFYPNDFLSGTQFFTDEQTGKYIRLLMAQHQHGHLPESHMLIICKSYDKDIFSKFIKDSEGFWYNERLEIEIVKRKEYAKTRSENRTGKKKISKSYVPHMENRNENENRNGSLMSLEVYRENIGPIFIDNLKTLHAGKDIEKAIKESYTYLIADKNRASRADSTDCAKLLTTWLSNMKPETSKPVRTKLL